jgi:hypothetical protein
MSEICVISVLDESPYDVDTYLDCAGRVEHAGGHDRSVLGKGKRQGAGELQPHEVVTICDHLVSNSSVVSWNMESSLDKKTSGPRGGYSMPSSR